MDIDALIGLSEEQSKSQPRLWDQQEQENEIDKLVNTHKVRLTQSSNLDVQTASLLELAQIAVTHPRKVANMMDTVVQLIAHAVNTKASNAGFGFLQNLVFKGKEGSQEHVNALLAVAGFLNITMEQARLFQLPGEQNYALQMLMELLQNSATQDTVAKLLRNDQQLPFYTTPYDLGPLVAGLLAQSEETSKQLIRMLVFELVDQQQIEKFFAECPGNLVQQIIVTIQQDRLQSRVSSDSAKLLLEFLQHQKTRQLAQRSLVRTKQQLHDLFHALAYQYIQGQISQIGLASINCIVQILDVLLSCEPDLREFYSQTKVFDYCVMMVCSVGDQTVRDNTVTTSAAMNILLQLVAALDDIKIKLAVCVVQTAAQPQNGISVPLRLAQIAIHGHIEQAVQEKSSQLLEQIFCQTSSLGFALAASLSKPLRVACKGSWADGFKTIIQAFAIKSPQQHAQVSEVAQDARYQGYIRTSQVATRQMLVNIELPQYEINQQMPELILNELLQGERHAAASRFMSQIVAQSGEACFHIMVSCMDETQLRQVKNNNQLLKVQTVACVLFKQLVLVSDEQAIAILDTLAAAQRVLQNEVLFQLILCGLDGQQACFQQSVQALVRLYGKGAQTQARTVLSGFPISLVEVCQQHIQDFSDDFLRQLVEEETNEQIKQSLLARVNHREHIQAPQKEQRTTEGVVDKRLYDELLQKYNSVVEELNHYKRLAQKGQAEQQPTVVQSYTTGQGRNRRKMQSSNDFVQPTDVVRTGVDSAPPPVAKPGPSNDAVEKPDGE